MVSHKLGNVKIKERFGKEKETEEKAFEGRLDHTVLS